MQRKARRRRQWLFHDKPPQRGDAPKYVCPSGLSSNAASAALRTLAREWPLPAARALHPSALGDNALHAVNVSRP
ncbi:MAG: hypothetical protein A2Z44_03370 [Betaproteobacteria bacterium RBG_19FT_COMBO_58_11]|nr:MAG: hypothetical protein A2Z44_03370 [Betaproteobacteria bacterium RBG_19FT_COMBO_58_11]